DVLRALGGRPLVARQDSIGDRAYRFARRHRVALAGAGLVIASLVGGATVAVYQARQAVLARARAEQRLTELIELSNRTLYDVHPAIAPLPGGTEARRQIVSTTLGFLETLWNDANKDAKQDDRLRFALSVSYARVAGVLGDPTHSSLGDSRGALENYTRS